MVDVVTLSQLQALAATLPKEEPTGGQRNGQASDFDLEGFIGRHLEVHHEGAWGSGGYRWILKGCPFNSDHAELSAYVARRPGGAIVAGCQHYSCKKTWGWRELREKFEPKSERARQKPKGKKEKAERSTPPDPDATVQPPPADPPPLAAEQRILPKLKVAVRNLGVVGEETTACITYLTLTSRVLDKQASLAVKGHSASGKSYTVETTVRFFPPEAVVVMTAMSERALVYSPEDYRHRTLILYEAAALREGQEDNQTAYFVRSLLSEGRIEYPVTVKGKDGEFTTRTIVKEGPTNLIVTTTKVRVEAENETRLLSVTTDDTREQTARVFAALVDETDSGVDLEEWVQLQRWLASAEHRVTIPYGRRLAELVPPVAVRLRRDFGTLLALVRAHAILHQQTRKRDPVGRIIATTDDYEQVRALVEGVIAEGVGATVSRTIRETVEAVRKLTVPPSNDIEAKYPDGAPGKVIAADLQLDKSAGSRRLQAARSAGYLVNVEERRGRPGRWKLGDALPDCERLLPDAAMLATAPEPEPAGQPDDPVDGCTVAGESEGVESDPPLWRCDRCGTERASLIDLTGFPHVCDDGARGSFHPAGRPDDPA